MQIDSIDAVLYSVQFLLPGYIICRIIAILSPQKNFTEGEQTLRAIGYSVINLAVWCWLFLWLQNLCNNCTAFKFLLNIIAVICSSCVTGFVIGLLRKHEIVRRLAEKIGLVIEHPIPTAWDYKFSDGKPYWVEVTISNEKVIRGMYAGKSLSSSSTDYRDIFIEEVYLKESDEWKRVDRTAGVWINPDEIRYIKFYDFEDTRNE